MSVEFIQAAQIWFWIKVQGSSGKFKKLTNEVAASTAKLIKQTKFLSNAIDSNSSFDEM